MASSIEYNLTAGLTAVPHLAAIHGRHRGALIRMQTATAEANLPAALHTLAQRPSNTSSE